MTAKGSKIGGELAREAALAVKEEADRAAGSQVEFFPLPVDDDQPGRAAIEREAGKVRKGAGRPEGSQNATTKALRDYMLKRGIVPQFAMMQLVQMGPRGYAKFLEVDGSAEGRLKAAAEWRQLADSLSRYVMAPMQPVDDQGRSVPLMQVYIGSDGRVIASGPGGEKLPPWLAHEPERNQALSEGEDPKSQSEESQE